MTKAGQFSNQDPNSEPGFSSHLEYLEYQWKQFTDTFPTDQDCVEELFRLVTDQHIQCPKCCSEKIQKSHNSRVITCNDCKMESYSLAGSLFHNIRRPKAWLGAIWFMDHGVDSNSSEFARLAKVVASTAQEIFKKLSLIVVSEMTELPEVHSGEFISTFCKRSRKTPAGEHPVAEQAEIDKDFSTNIESQGVASCSGSASNQGKGNAQEGESHLLSDFERPVYEAMETELLHFDVLFQRTAMDAGKLSAALVLLELKGLVKRHGGDCYSLSAPPTSPITTQALPEQAETTIDSFVEFIRATFKGISRKYIQNYLALYWCINDRTCWQQGTLLKKCLAFRRITYDEILNYVSPAMVKISIAASARL